MTKEYFEELFKKHYTSLVFFAEKFLWDEEVGRDIVADVFVVLWKSGGGRH